jgi:glycosyltransferase involved in cell wall biosynthesis
LEIEILMIDDASTDRCGEICNSWAAKDKRFRVIHQGQNMGLSEARNTGIRHAVSDYLMFVDSDDFVHEDFCKAAYECAVSYQAELVIFNRQHCDSAGRMAYKSECQTDMATEGYKTQREALDLILKHRGVGTVVWNKLYRKELFHTICYPPGFYYEDLGTTYKLVLKANHIYYLNRVLYFWCYRPGSITTLQTKKTLRDRHIMLLQRFRDLVAFGYYPEEKTECMLLNIYLGYCICQKPDTSDLNYVSCANYLRESDVVPKDFTWKLKTLLFLFRHYPTLFEVICRLYGKKVD